MITATKPSAAETAAAILAAAAEYGFTVQVHDRLDIVTVTKSFTAGDRDAYVLADGTAYNVLRHVPMTNPGTVWGTDGASVGGHAGMMGGYYRLSKSGASKRVMAQLRKQGAGVER